MKRLKFGSLSRYAFQSLDYPVQRIKNYVNTRYKYLKFASFICIFDDPPIFCLRTYTGLILLDKAETGRLVGKPLETLEPHETRWRLFDSMTKIITLVKNREMSQVSN
jgi:hypothetical protein